MTQEDRDRIVNILQERHAILNCPRCGHGAFSLMDGYFNHSFQQQIGSTNIVIGGPTVPSVAVLCNQCGFISFHAAGVLGLMPPQQTNHEEN